VKLPPNWKEVKEEDGSTVYVNSITHRRSVEAALLDAPGSMLAVTRLGSVGT
jgi:hypothetical protein